jgi:hypothetical protein
VGEVMCQHRTKSANEKDVVEEMQQRLLFGDATLNQIIQDTEADDTLIGRLHSNHRRSGV